ncbi:MULTISPECIES: NAD(+) diphosphatase [Legionella]|uniref:NAD(+) diphosphatase n=1 Tax=Legionella resiliens TaxID=2905958 RepID=A0ABS8X1G0_9GAMM|nr:MULTISPECIES: NAD(+) diphosphatase [unclassified Legionella]MCE0722497.1 NAD(+) diphosphatase [Legionella sp. 9fVS26]MCE3531651.1 NAD(+) diphosphatase [Legionella sp. 8cVS16]QLZ67672.1 NAD(+) diphosphatase [Legionella sp. PC1000]
MSKPFISQIHPPASFVEPPFWFIFHGEDILLQNHTIPQLSNINALNLSIERQIYLGTYGNTPCFAAQISAQPFTLPPNMAFQHIRQAHELLRDEDLFLLVSKAKQLLHWDNSTQFCGCCGHQTQYSTKERAKVCPVCNSLIFPQIAPVMMVLIWRDDEILLARSPHFMPGIYSLLAGFVEPGEMLEQTVMREVKEEVSLNIKNLHYFASQPWPFQSNLMLGFIAEYDSGDIQIDATEIEDAQWFSIKNLPQLPKPISLSRQMIDKYLAMRL